MVMNDNNLDNLGDLTDMVREGEVAVFGVKVLSVMDADGMQWVRYKVVGSQPNKSEMVGTLMMAVNSELKKDDDK